MHVGLIADEERLLHEHDMLDRLCLGLLEKDLTVTRFLPAHLDLESREGVEPLDERVGQVDVPMNVPPWMHGARARQLAAAVDKATPDVLYAVGAPAWFIGLQLARELQRPLAVELWSARQVRTAPRGRSAHPVSAYIAPSRPIADALRKRVDPGLVSVIPMGVVVPEQPRMIMENPDDSISVAVIGGGRDVPSYTAMLAGLSRVVRELPQVQAAVELRGPHAHDVWREAQRLDLLSNVSAIIDAAPLRALLTSCDVLLMPERYGEMRSLTLEAMSRGMAIVTSADPALDMLIDDQTAAVVPEPSAEQWVRQMRKIFMSADQARRLGEGAHRLALARHQSSQQVEGLQETLQKMLSGGSYSFAEARQQA